MASWVDDYARRTVKLLHDADGDGYASRDEEFEVIVRKLLRRAAEEAARRCRTSGSRKDVLAMLTDEKEGG